MIGWKDIARLRIFDTLRLKKDAAIIAERADGTETRLDVAELAALNDIAAADLAKIDGITNGTPAAGKALVLDANRGIGAFRQTGGNLFPQAAPAAKTTSTTLTAAELLGRLITGNQGGGAGASYTLPLATDLETALLAVHPGLQNDDAFDFNVINISTVAAEDITIVTNTGWTLVGSMLVIEQAAGNPGGSNGHFRARRTAANTYTLYRIA